MPDQCCAGFCSNTRADGFHLHKFPPEESVRNKWVQQVRRTRSGPKGSPWKLTPYAVLCSAHFDEGCYDTGESLKEQFGLKVKSGRVLLPGAVPSIFPRGPATPEERTSSRISGAVQKRRHLEVLVW